MMDEKIDDVALFIYFLLMWMPCGIHVVHFWVIRKQVFACVFLKTCSYKVVFFLILHIFCNVSNDGFQVTSMLTWLTRKLTCFHVVHNIT